MSIENPVLPDDVLELEDNYFFEFVKLFAGEKLASVVKFQDISNAQCLLACDDPFEILTLNSDDLFDLQKQTCIKLKSNEFVILPGLTCKMKILKGTLSKKPNIASNINGTGSASLNNSIDNAVNHLTQVSVQESNNLSSSTLSNYGSEDKLKQHLIDLIDDWCKKSEKNKNHSAFYIKQDVDYQSVIDLISNKVVIKCQCVVKSVLGLKKKR
ncbi:hypothetical protein I4U23_017074 [Adineta vaga]|nr:hypothetical protein I4U23_017074 [Adineta vaga]